MNLRQLYYFKTIAELEHYTKASEKLFVSQSSLSHAIQKLEEELNIELFSRQGRNIRLTRSGEIFYPHVKKTLETLENGIAVLKEYTNPDTGTVVLSGFPSVDQFVSDTIVQYLSATNRINIKFQYKNDGYREIHNKLLNGQIDLAFATQIDDDSIGCAPIGIHELVLLVPESHHLAQYDSIDLRQLDGEKFTAYDSECQLGPQLKGYFEAFNIKPNIVMEARQDFIIYSMVSSQHSVAITPLPLAGPPYKVKVLKITNELPPRQLYILWNKDRNLAPVAEYFREFVIDRGEIFTRYLHRIMTIGNSGIGSGTNEKENLQSAVMESG